jgi:hypothetical protein
MGSILSGSGASEKPGAVHLVDVFTPTECANYFAAAGYDAT